MRQAGCRKRLKVLNLWAAPPQVPNLIADLTSKMGRTPQKRLEQMIDFDDEQAAAILKQWMRGARSA